MWEHQLELQHRRSEEELREDEVAVREARPTKMSTQPSQLSGQLVKLLTLAGVVVMGDGCSGVNSFTVMAFRLPHTFASVDKSGI